MKIKVQNTPKKTQLLCGFALEKSDKVLGLPKLEQKHHLQLINLSKT